MILAEERERGLWREREDLEGLEGRPLRDLGSLGAPPLLGLPLFVSAVDPFPFLYYYVGYLERQCLLL